MCSEKYGWWGKSRLQEDYDLSWNCLVDPNFEASSALLSPLNLHWDLEASFSTCLGPLSWDCPCHNCNYWACGWLYHPRCTKKVHFPPGSASPHQCGAGEREEGKRHSVGNHQSWSVLSMELTVRCNLCLISAAFQWVGGRDILICPERIKENHRGRQRKENKKQTKKCLWILTLWEIKPNIKE